MARSPKPHKPAADQYGLDFESSRNERYALFMSAIEAAGLRRLKDLAILLFNTLEQQNGPAGFAIDDYVRLLSGAGKPPHANTVRRWLHELSAIGLLSMEPRTYHRGGTRTNLVTINWLNVRTFAVGRHAPKLEKPENLDRPTKMVGRPTTLVGRPTILVGPIKEYSLPDPHLEITPPPSATTCAAATTRGTEPRNEEEEIFLRQLSAACREHLKHQTPRRLLPALRQALANGLTRDQLRERCRWFAKNQLRWRAENDQRAGAFHDGLVEATPDLPANEGWPYQR